MWSLDVAEHFAERSAIEKGPEVPFVHWLAAVVALWKRNLEGAKRETQIGLALNPNYALAYGTRGHVEVYAGNPMEGIPSIPLRPSRPLLLPSNTRTSLARPTLFAGKYEAAAAALVPLERIRLSPETDLSRGLLASALGVTLARSTRPASILGRVEAGESEEFSIHAEHQGRTLSKRILLDADKDRRRPCQGWVTRRNASPGASLRLRASVVLWPQTM